MNFSKSTRLAILVGMIGVATSLAVYLSQQNAIALYEEQLPFIKLADHVRNKTTRSHLWLEELLDGDKSINFQQQIVNPLISSQQILQSAYDGNSTELGTFLETEHEETRALLKETIISNEKLVNSARLLWDGYQAADTTAGGSKMLDTQYEQDFDAAFVAFHSKLDQLSKHLHLQADTSAVGVQNFSWIAIMGTLAVFSFVTFLVFNAQRSVEKQLQENNSKLESESQRVGTLSQFIESVSAGNYEIELKSADENDNLISMLVAMRDKLRTNTEEERKRSWATSGLAQIGEILRSTNDSAGELYDRIIQFMVKYTRSNQGGLFILNDEEEQEPYLELLACYAFERKKFLTKKVGMGDGLVGQCFLEGEKIHVTEVPKEYVAITSGLGGSTPSSLLIVPMKINDKIFGVVELASFNNYEEHEIALIEKFAESVASTVSNVRVNVTTKILLEKTQQQAEEMKSQEEEIRQNMEELEATQEEMRRKQLILEEELGQSQQQAESLRIKEEILTKSQTTLQAIVDNIPRAIFWKDHELRFLGCNIIFAKAAGMSSPSDLIGKTDFDMPWSAQADAYRRDDLEVMKNRKSKLDIEEVNVDQSGEESWVRTSKVPVIDQKGNVVAILGMFEDITAFKQREADVAEKLKERDLALQELKALKDLIGVRNG